MDNCTNTDNATNQYCRLNRTESSRLLALIADKGLVDPDRYFWSMLPIGEPPPRRGTTAAIWSDAARSPAALPSAERVG